MSRYTYTVDPGAVETTVVGCVVTTVVCSVVVPKTVDRVVAVTVPVAVAKNWVAVGADEDEVVELDHCQPLE